MPMTKVAEKFEVSGSYMARVCSIPRVPRPERDYWAKLAVGKAHERVPLPESQPGDQLSWSPGGESRSLPLPTPTSPKPRTLRSLRPVTGVHGLIRGAKEQYEARYKVDEGQLLKPYNHCQTVLRRRTPFCSSSSRGHACPIATLGCCAAPILG